MATLIYSKGSLPGVAAKLKQHLNEMLYPNSFPNFKYHNSLKDILSVAHSLKISFLMKMNATVRELRFDVAKVPSGPTLSFEVLRYFTYAEAPKSSSKAFTVFTNFDNSQNATFAKELLKQILPAAEQSEQPQRIIVVNYEPDTKTIQLRHYYYHDTENTAKILQKLRYHRTNFSYFTSFDELTETGQTNPLQEIGPKIDMRLVKVEADLFDGACLLNEKVYVEGEKAVLMRKKAEMRVKLRQSAEKRSKHFIFYRLRAEEAERKKQEEQEKKQEEKKKENALLNDYDGDYYNYVHKTREERRAQAQKAVEKQTKDKLYNKKKGK